MDDDLNDEQRNALGQLRRTRGACPSTEALLAYGEADPALRRGYPIHDHVQICSRCQLALHHSREPNTAVWKSRWFFPILIPAAAMALLVVFIVPSYFRSPEPAPDDTIRGTDVQLVAPVGSVRSVAEFIWQSPIRVPRYRVNVYRGTERIWSAEATMEKVAVPPDLRLEPNVDYQWEVEALNQDGIVQMTSRRQTFRLR